MAPLTYLRVEGARVTVEVDRRDWDDHNVAAHVAYHRSVLLRADCPFTVLVDASSVPFKALFHVAFFRELCSVVRREFKGKLSRCVIYGAPHGIVALYNTLIATGCVSASTASKIAFVDKQSDAGDAR
jgi:hypothetical protein